MKTITFAEALRLIDEAAAVIVDDNYVTYPQINDPDGEEDVHSIELAATTKDWENDINVSRFCAKDNATVKINADGALVLIDMDGFSNTVTLLTRWKL